MSMPSHECAPVSPLVATLMESMARQTQWTTNAVIDGATYDAAKSRATLELVREAITGLLSHSFMPMPHMFERAMYPPQEVIEARMRENGYKKEK